MRNKIQKTRCEKQMLPHFEGICKTYDKVQTATAIYLSKLADDDIISISANIDSAVIDGTQYTTDFVCKKRNGELVVYECAYRKLLTKPLTVKLLEASRNYWLKRGVTDWVLVIDENGGGL